MDMCFTFLIVLALCVTVLGTGFMVSLSLPRSRLRCVVIQITGWCFTALCGAYVVSPVDLIPEAALGPFGLIDDFGAVVAAFVSAQAAIKAGKEARELGRLPEQAEQPEHGRGGPEQ